MKIFPIELQLLSCDLLTFVFSTELSWNFNCSFSQQLSYSSQCFVIKISYGFSQYNQFWSENFHQSISDQKAVAQLRKITKVKKLIYVSCNPNAAFKNFIDFGRPTSKTMQGEPFLPVKAVAVDMFPYTEHCELVLYFERADELIIQS